MLIKSMKFNYLYVIKHFYYLYYPGENRFNRFKIFIEKFVLFDGKNIKKQNRNELIFKTEKYDLVAKIGNSYYIDDNIENICFLSNNKYADNFLVALMNNDKQLSMKDVINEFIRLGLVKNINYFSDYLV